MRYPGGNFLSGYNWEDGVGPKDKRPARRDLAWCSTETNQFGTNEFIDWCRKADVEPMFGVNLGTARPRRGAATSSNTATIPAARTIPICAARTATRSRTTSSSGASATKWTAPGRSAHKTADEYGRAAQETAKVMRWVDPDLELAACGSSNRNMPHLRRLGI